MNTYVTFDPRSTDESYIRQSYKFFDTLREVGFKVIVVDYKWYNNEQGGEYAKANADIHMAVDMITQTDNLDHVILLTGDGDFSHVVSCLQNKGCRVEVIAFKNVSSELKREADHYTNGYLIPGLVPCETNTPPADDTRAGQGDKHEQQRRRITDLWQSHRVRGTCYFYDAEKQFGFFRFMHRIDENWVTDTRDPYSPYQAAFFCKDEMGQAFSGDLPCRDKVYEFHLSINPDISPNAKRPTTPFVAKSIVRVA
jgi:hypothetical protein